MANNPNYDSDNEFMEMLANEDMADFVDNKPEGPSPNPVYVPANATAQALGGESGSHAALLETISRLKQELQDEKLKHQATSRARAADALEKDMEIETLHAHIDVLTENNEFLLAAAEANKHRHDLLLSSVQQIREASKAMTNLAANDVPIRLQELPLLIRTRRINFRHYDANDRKDIRKYTKVVASTYFRNETITKTSVKTFIDKLSGRKKWNPAQALIAYLSLGLPKETWVVMDKFLTSNIYLNKNVRYWALRSAEQKPKKFSLLVDEGLHLKFAGSEWNEKIHDLFVEAALPAEPEDWKQRQCDRGRPTVI